MIKNITNDLTSYLQNRLGEKYVEQIENEIYSTPNKVLLIDAKKNGQLEDMEAWEYFYLHADAFSDRVKIIDKSFNELIKEDTEDVQLLHSYAQFLEGIKQNIQAETYYLKAIAVNNTNHSGATIFNNYGVLLINQGEPAKAYKVFLIAATLSKEDQTAYSIAYYYLNYLNDKTAEVEGINTEYNDSEDINKLLEKWITELLTKQK